MKILNKESLKKCGFKFSEEYDVHYCERWNHGTDEQEGKGTIEVCNKTLKIINIKALGGTGLDLVTKIIYDMVKAGCFDEPKEKYDMEYFQK